MENEKHESYEIFKTEIERAEVVDIVTSLARHIHDKSIENIVFLDRSARPAYLALIKSWNQLYPDEKRPGMYFVNPKGFDTCYRKEDEIIREFKDVHEFLMKDTEKPILVFDICVHSGLSVSRVAKILTKVGFQKVNIGSIYSPNSSYHTSNTPQMSFSALPEEVPDRCYFFDKDTGIEKKGNSVLSSKSPARRAIENSLKIREEITSIFSDVMRKEREESGCRDD
jgi:hypothetical protein